MIENRAAYSVEDPFPRIYKYEIIGTDNGPELILEFMDGKLPPLRATLDPEYGWCLMQTCGQCRGKGIVRTKPEGRSP